MTYDKIIIGAGLYGLYAAQKCGAAGQRDVHFAKYELVAVDDGCTDGTVNALCG